MNKLHNYLIAIGVQVVVLLAIVVFKLLVITGGETVYLKVSPVDPRSPLRGDYITVEYDISRISLTQFGDFVAVQDGKQVYVSLRENNGYWVVSNVGDRPPTDGRMYIKGTITDPRFGLSNQAPKPNTLRRPDTDVHITYGIEQYYIAENTGSVLDSASNLVARVKIDESGYAVLEKLLTPDELRP